MNENTIKSPLLPDTIHFNHTMENANTEVMRITREGVWANPDMQVDETAKAVLDALDFQIKVLVQRAVEDERLACAKLCEEYNKRQCYNDEDMAVANECAQAIRERFLARGEK